MLSRGKYIKTLNRPGRIKMCITQDSGFGRKKGVMIHMSMVKDQLFGKTMRKSYAKYNEILEMPNMLKIQKDSYQWFLDEGLREVFKDVGVITDFSGKLELSFLDYSMEDKPKYTIEECKERDATYARPIKVRVRLRNT